MLPEMQLAGWVRETVFSLAKHGSIVSASPFKAPATQGDNSCSLEIWLKPSRIDSRAGGMILAFYLPESRLVPFALRQFQARSCAGT